MDQITIGGTLFIAIVAVLIATQRVKYNDLSEVKGKLEKEIIRNRLETEYNDKRINALQEYLKIAPDYTKEIKYSGPQMFYKKEKK